MAVDGVVFAVGEAALEVAGFLLEEVTAAATAAVEGDSPPTRSRALSRLARNSLSRSRPVGTSEVLMATVLAYELFVTRARRYREEKESLDH